jgi:hypothetical protein
MIVAHKVLLKLLFYLQKINTFIRTEITFEPYFLNEFLYMSDFSVLDMKKSLSISARVAVIWNLKWNLENSITE